MRPTITFLVLLTWFAAVSTGAQLTDPARTSDATTILDVFIVSTLVAAAGTVVVIGGRWWQRRRGVTMASHFVTLVLAALVITGVRFATFPFERVVINTGPALVFVALRTFLLLMLVTAVAGVVTWRLTQQVHRAESALETARKQQIDLVRADEEVRRQMASLLHDQVQSSLIAVCLRLQSLTGRVSDSERAVLVEAVDRLEQLRALDVRTAVRRLSPSLDEVDLQSAIEELAATYEPAVEVRTAVEPEIDSTGVDSQVRLAIYRIVEQGLMNAVVHGGADRIDVRVSLEEQAVRVRVVDYGGGLPDGDLDEGMGLLLVSTWARALNGAWSLRSHGSGAELTAELPSHV